MTPEQLVDQLKQAIPAGLRSVILYGSAAAGDHIGGKSDYNVLIAAERLGPAELRAISTAIAEWTSGGNRPPLLFTPDELKRSADSFPIEISDILQSRKILFGEDILANAAVKRENLRLQLEMELKGKLLRLREQYLLTRGKPEKVAGLLTSSLSTFLVLIRAALRLWQNDVPARKSDAMLALARHIHFDPQVFSKIMELKEGRLKYGRVQVDGLFENYLQAVETIVDAVDHKQSGEVYR